MNESRKKAGILTFHWADDYGAMLQTYGLKTAVASMGIDVEVIPYAPYKYVGRYWLFPYRPNVVRGLRRGLLKLRDFEVHRAQIANLLNLKVVINRYINMRKFRRAYLTDKPPIRNNSKIDYDKYDTVIIGSDQVWNPILTIGFDDAYFGIKPDKKNSSPDAQSRSANRCRRIAYAASLGSSEHAIEYQDEFKTKIAGMDAISLREKSAVGYIESLYGKKVSDVLDPTMLLARDEWERVAEEPKDTNYILVYEVAPDKRIAEYANALATATGKKIIRLKSSPSGRHDDPTVWRKEAGPLQFLGYIKNADYVVTNSFHGTVFSILFERQFVTYGYTGRNARMEDLLDNLNISSRFVDSHNSLPTNYIDNEIGWDDVRDRLCQAKQKSMDYLINNV